MAVEFAVQLVGVWEWAFLVQLVGLAVWLWLASAYAVALRYGEALLAVIPWPDRRRPYRLVYLKVDNPWGCR